MLPHRRTRAWRFCLPHVAPLLLCVNLIIGILPVDAKNIIKIGYVTGSEPPQKPLVLYKRPGHLISGALTYAIEEVNNDSSILPNYTLDYVIAETHGEEQQSIKETVLLRERNISVYLGPQETCVHEGRIAAAFNLPMISYFCAQTEVSNKQLYPTFARTKPTDFQISKSLVSILKLFNWKKVTFLHSDKTSYVDTADTICKLLKEYDINVTFRRGYTSPYFHQHTENPFIKIVAETKTDTRIYVMLGHYYEFMGLMDHLYEAGLLDSAEYFVVGVEVNQFDPMKPQKFMEGLFDTNVTRRSAAAFRHFVSVVTSPPIMPDFWNFSSVVNHYLEAPPFNYTNPYKELGGIKAILPEAAYLYDAVWLYARATQKVLEKGGDINDGRAIIEQIMGMTYKSALGYINRINSMGDAEGNFSLIARQPIPDRPDEWGLLPVGVFRLNDNISELPTFHFYEGEKIHWISGEPPRDEPECGYRHEKCIPPKTYTKEILSGVAGGILLVGSLVGYLIYRNWSYEQELASLLWKIDFKDLQFGDNMYQPHGGQRSKCNPLCKSGSQISLTSQADFDTRQLFTHVGSYRGTIVAIRKINKKHVELTRNIRKELKIIRELRHDNMNPFIGACIDSPNILVITAYCARGSLQDILENDDMQLDAMLIASLAFDVVRGMIYLHDSEMKSHGKLKSSNCVVDSRWVLKITDCGLHEFVSGAEDDMGDYAFYRNQLWRAPELLRNKRAPCRGSQEGDVYSFAIIMFEIFGRKGPFGNIDLSPQEIIERIKFSYNGVPFRPHLSQLGQTHKFITDLIKECWDEDPFKRPDFKVIRSKLKPMQKGMKSNIFDNMLAIMEKYADNLEALVEERTDQLIEEKKKTEELLHQMLPRIVADQLMRGKQVEAEAFDNVTIYFSDICGFTQLSSESTPLQVIDLLNDLYTLFDATIEYYDVYKVETIGDAYMVVSGLPNRNDSHAGEIASMSLHLLEAIKKFRMKHRPDTLKLRIGLHSGPCVAGVVGLKMPRYCLFGDTVNTASRMESNGEPLKIHCSRQCAELLHKIGGYTIEDRGFITLKGKGEMRTFWLTGEDEEKRHHRFKQLAPLDTTPLSSAGSYRRLVGVHYKEPNSPFREQGSPGAPEKATLPNGTTVNNQIPSFLHPHGLFSGPSSAELLRRSSSRRRRLKFTVGSEDEEMKENPAEYQKTNATVETTPLILRKTDAGEENMLFSRCTSRL
ncbi:speract receptor-like [Haliotis cracherodii]|uniref:speract receptor-like n=1 Tax=Haliotis cracherodii TaxID=6455 RepID=UPI0039E8E3CC